MWFKKNARGGKNVYMLLDRSGSMASGWPETLGSINGYVQKLENDVNVYLAVFDDLDFTVIRESTAGSWKPVTNEDAAPRGSTPLYDSAAKVMDRMIADNPERAVLVIMTDGYENASKEYSLDAVKARLASLKAKDWPAVFLGADFSNITTYTTSTFNVSSSNVVNTTVAYRGLAMAMNAAKTSNYFNEASNSAASFSSMNWTEQEKATVDGTLDGKTTKNLTDTTTNQ